MSTGKRSSFCQGGSTVIPCPHNGWVRVHPFGQMEEGTVVCGKHYVSAVRDLFKRFGSMVVTERMGE